MKLTYKLIFFVFPQNLFKKDSINQGSVSSAGYNIGMYNKQVTWVFMSGLLGKKYFKNPRIFSLVEEIVGAV